VSCRFAGCEVQAEVQMRAPNEAPTAGREDSREVLHEISPVGPSLAQEDYIGSDLGEAVGTAQKVGFIVWYRRVALNAEATSAGPQSTAR
jgi:hypothetical protein